MRAERRGDLGEGEGPRKFERAHAPRCREHIHAVEPLGAVHLRQHLVHDAVGDACAVVPAVFAMAVA